MPTELIRRGVAADAPALAAFAAQAFADAFGVDNDPADLTAHLSKTYRTELQAAELVDPAVVTLLVLHDERIVGYSQVRTNASPPICVTHDAAVEVQRFYVDNTLHGRGLAARLMEQALLAAVELGGRHAWLGVWERNERAQAFYRKAGFVDIGSTHYVVGSDRQTDRVYLASLEPRIAVARERHDHRPLEQT